MYMWKLVARQKKQIDTDESGFAAIVIAIVMVLVLSLTTLGFSQLVNREQKSATDKHLSSQAYYNAETGVNDAAKAINEGFNEKKEKCGPLTTSDSGASLVSSKYLKNNSVGGAGNSYTCLLIDPNPSDLQYTSIDDQSSKTVIISGVNPSNPNEHKPIGRLVIGWKQAGDGASSFVTSGFINFKAKDDANPWNYDPVLRVSLTPIDDKSLINRNSLISNTFTSFFYPSAGSANSPGSINNASGEQGVSSGKITSGNCNSGNTVNSTTPQACNVVIRNNDPHSDYLLNMRSIYGKSRVSIYALDTAGNPLNIANAQTVIDSTGRAQDVYRRIQTRIPSKNVSEHSDYAIEAASGICKQLQLLPSSGTNECAP